MLTAGGNELGFTDIIANCFGPRIPGALEGANGTRCREGVAATMAGLPEMLDRLKSQISRLITERMTGNPKSQVILLAYPLLSLDRPYHLPDGAVSYDAARGVRELGRAAIREQRRIIDELENDFPRPCEIHRRSRGCLRRTRTGPARVHQEQTPLDQRVPGNLG